MEYFKKHPNEDMPHGPVVDWVEKKYLKLYGRKSRDTWRAIRKLHQEGKLIKVKKGRYRYDPDYVHEVDIDVFTQKQKEKILKRDGYKVYAFGDYKIKNAINPPTPTLTELRNWLSQMEFYIGVDSGIMHLADALRIPMVVIFGATHVRKNQPFNEPNIVLQPKIECAPCYGLWGSVNCFQDPKYQCMLYSASEVYDKFYKLKNSVD